MNKIDEVINKAKQIKEEGEYSSEWIDEFFKFLSEDDKNNITPERAMEIANDIINKKERYRGLDDIHRELDGLLLSILTHHGYGELAVLFLNTDKWYA